MTKHAPGTVVMLNSGGPKMTVEEKDEEGELTCVWFVGKKTKRDVFPASALKVVAEESAGDGD